MMMHGDGTANTWGASTAECSLTLFAHSVSVSVALFSQCAFQSFLCKKSHKMLYDLDSPYVPSTYLIQPFSILFYVFKLTY